MALVDNRPRSASVIAKTDCVCVEITRLAFQKRLEDIPKWMQSFYQIVIERLRETDRRLDSLTIQDKAHQIVHLISEKMNQENPNAQGHVSIPWEHTIKEISFILNYPKEKVEKVFVKLALSTLSKGKIGDFNTRMLFTDCNEDLQEFAIYCKNKYYESLGKPTGVESIEKKMLQFMLFLKSLLESQVTADDLDEQYLITQCENKLGKSLDYFKNELSDLSKKNVVIRKKRDIGGLYYDVDRKRLFNRLNKNKKKELFENLDKLLAK